MSTQAEFLKVLSSVNEAVNTKKAVEDFVNSFAAMIKIFQQMKAENQKERDDLASTVSQLVKDMKDKLATLKDGHTPTTQELLALIRPLIPAPIQPRQPKEIDMPLIIATVLSHIPPAPAPVVMPDIPDHTEEIDALQAQIDELKNRPSGQIIGGRMGLGLYVGNAKKGIANNVNFKAGSGVTLAHSTAQGRNDITISASGGGGGGFTILDLATPDGTTTNFTVPAHTSLVVYLNGIMQRAGGVDYTDNGTSITFAVAPLGPPDVATPWITIHYN